MGYCDRRGSNGEPDKVACKSSPYKTKCMWETTVSWPKGQCIKKKSKTDEKKAAKPTKKKKSKKSKSRKKRKISKKKRGKKKRGKKKRGKKKRGKKRKKKRL